MGQIKDYYLLLDKIMDLPTPKRNIIMDMYRDMIHRLSDTSSKDFVQSVFNTLEMNGYIANRQMVERTRKLENLVDGEN